MCGSLGDCGVKLNVSVYLGCVFQEVIGRDHLEWIKRVWGVHVCIAWVFCVLCVLRCCAMLVVLACTL